MRASSLYGHTSDQLYKLCRVAGIADPQVPDALLRDLLGLAGARSVSEAPVWPSNVADDTTPIEFSVALDHERPPTLRILAETFASHPSAVANLRAARQLLDVWADRFEISLDRFRRVQDLFLPADPQGIFSLWYSLVFRPGDAPDFKIYFNPDVRGRECSAELVADGLRRLGLDGAYQTTLSHGVRPGQLGEGDRFAFFALDLNNGPRSRVKVYLSHEAAEERDMVRAAGAVDGISADQITEFCKLIGGDTGPFTGLPLVSSYTFVEGDSDRPSGYSLYIPIRGYVGDDEEARDRVLAMAVRYGFDASVIDRAIEAVARRPLADGVGLIAHASLRLGPDRPGVTVYLSSEAHEVMPPRSPQMVAAVNLASGSIGRDAGRPLNPVQ
jgi:DMATS type aromatic prenyltransferase